MKRFSTILLILITATTLFSQENTEKELILRKLIGELTSLVEKGDNVTLKNTLSLPLEKFRNNELHFRIVERIEGYSESYLGNAMFTFSNENTEQPQFITIEEKLLRFYPDNRSLIMAVIMHEISHANNYYNDPEYMISLKDNKLEKYLYEMDARFVEALFIESSGNQGYLLSPFENFLLESLNEDNLARSSLILERVDNRLVWEMIHKKDSYLNEEISIEALLSYLIKTGEDSLESWNGNYKNSEVTWEKLALILKMKTYQEFIGSIVNYVMTEDIVTNYSSDISRINELIDALYKEVAEQWGATAQYRYDLMDKIQRIGEV